MHELSVCQEMMQQVMQIAAEKNASSVDCITVHLGPLSGIEAHLLKQAFPFAAAGTVAEQAELIIKELPVRVHCQQCGADTDARVNRLLCGECGDYHTQLISGDEMLLASLELSRKDQEASYV